MPSEAPSWRARSSLSSWLDVAITRAPARRANWSAKSETPPVPCTSTVSPGVTALADHQGMPGRDRGAGQGGRLLVRQVVGDGDQALLREDPRLGQHAVDRAAEGRGGASLGDLAASQPGMKAAATRSPGLNRVTPGPTSATSPAPSESGISGKGRLRL